MSKNPKISIILPSYNRAHFLPQTIESCQNQSFVDFELIIVDDCSKDSSALLAMDYTKKDPRIKLIVNEENKKLPATLNIGFKAAKGEYFTWISDDNLYDKDALKRMIEVLDSHQNIGLVYSDYTLIDDDANIGKRIYQEPPEFLPIRDCVGACFLYRADIAKQVGGYNEDMFLIEDYEYWLRFGLVSNLHHISEALYFYRVHAQSLTKTKKIEIREAKDRLKKIFGPKYTIPGHLQPINELYNWFIGNRNFCSYMRLLRILSRHPILTISYIAKNLRRMNIREILFPG